MKKFCDFFPQSSGLEVTYYTKLIVSPTHYLVQLSEIKDIKFGTVLRDFRKVTD